MRTVALVAGLLVGASGCAPAPAAPAREPADREGVPGASVERLSDGTAFLVAPPSNGNRMAAIVQGTLAVIGGDCLGFDEPGSGGTATLVLPHGSRPSDDGSAVDVPGGPTVRIGDAITGGGGYRSITEEAGVVATGWPDAPEACRSAQSLAGIYDVELATG